ncbi:unnamed protein product [Spodoptera exigua]|nr:unnamed protein product [Spodoptera exigua]
MKNLPVFVFPVSLEFYLNARHTHKQLLTVYNPYEFPVNFKVLCTSPKKFTVIDPEGVIAPQSCIDIVVRYTQLSQTHSDSIEKFRITMYDKNTQQVLGKRDVLTKLIEGEPSNISQECLGDDFHPLTMRPAPLRSTEEHSRVAPCSHVSHRGMRNRVESSSSSIEKGGSSDQARCSCLVGYCPTVVVGISV